MYYIKVITILNNRILILQIYFWSLQSKHTIFTRVFFFFKFRINIGTYYKKNNKITLGDDALRFT